MLMQKVPTARRGSNHAVGWVILHELRQGEPHSGVGLESGFERAVLDRLRVELLLKPGVQAHGAHSLEVAGAGAVGEPVEDVEDLLVP